MTEFSLKLTQKMQLLLIKFILI